MSVQIVSGTINGRDLPEIMSQIKRDAITAATNFTIEILGDTIPVVTGQLKAAFLQLFTEKTKSLNTQSSVMIDLHELNLPNSNTYEDYIRHVSNLPAWISTFMTQFQNNLRIEALKRGVILR